jgi:phage tail protein X
MADLSIAPVPPLTALGFNDPVWAKWLDSLRRALVVPPLQLAASVSLLVAQSAVIQNVVSLALPVGKWAVSGSIVFQPSQATTHTNLKVGVSVASKVFSSAPGYATWQGTAPAGAEISLAPPLTLVTTAVPTTVYLVASATFSGGAEVLNGVLTAQRYN